MTGPKTRTPARNVRGTFEEPSRNLRGTFVEPSWNLRGTFVETFVELSWEVQKPERNGQNLRGT
eukprot:7973165-Alexandrium_andersonii.AAC.1